MNYFISAVRDHYADFNGRASRKQFWMFQLFFYLFFFAIVLGMALITSMFGNPNPSIPITIISIIYLLAFIIPNLAIAIRRLHDINKSGWFLLISFIPYIGSIILLILYCIKGDNGSNRFGTDPLDKFEYQAY